MIKSRKKIFFIKVFSLLLVVFAVSLSSAYLGIRLGQDPTLLRKLLVSKTGESPQKFKTDKEIIEWIVSEVPVMRDYSASQFEKVNALREWVYTHVPVVVNQPELTIENVKKTTSASNIPLSERLYLFDSGIAGAWCSATATTLRSIYRLFGFEAYDISFGDVPGKVATHALTLVRILEGDHEVLAVEDAYFNYTLTDKEGRPLDYFDLLRLLRGRNESQVKLLYGSERDKPYLEGKDIKAQEEVEKVFANGNKLIRKPFILPDFDKAVSDFLLSYKLPDKLLYLQLFPFGVYGKDKEQAQLILNRAKRMTASWCYEDEGCLTE